MLFTTHTHERIFSERHEITLRNLLWIYDQEMRKFVIKILDVKLENESFLEEFLFDFFKKL